MLGFTAAMASDDYCLSLVRDRDRDRYLATLYAPAASRGALFALHALDLELAEVVRTTTEPMLGQIRLAWWREQLQALDACARPAQPVLAALAEHVLPRGVTGVSLEPLEDSCLALLSEGSLEDHAKTRGCLFLAAMRVLASAGNAEVARRLGAGWAAVEAIRQGRYPADTANLSLAATWLAPAALPAAARPILALATLARRDLAAMQQGKPLEPRGTPRRQMRLLWSMMTGM